MAIIENFRQGVFRKEPIVKEKNILDIYPDLELYKERLKGKHFAIILDGNATWAKENGKTTQEGHKAGAAAAKNVMKMCADLQMNVSLWILSPNNIEKRPKEEIEAIYKIIKDNLQELTIEAQKRNGKIIHVGETDGLPFGLKFGLWRAQRKTKDNSGPVVGLAINYGQTQQAIKIAEMANNKPRGTNFRKPGEIEKLMYAGGQISPTDMLVRTGNHSRLSGFGLPFMGDETELFFPKVNLPDFNEEHFHNVITEYFSREIKGGGRPNLNGTTFSKNGKN